MKNKKFKGEMYMMNKNYNELLNTINMILNKYDLAGLIWYEEEQENEYESETKNIISYLEENGTDSIFGLSCFIQNLFVKYFETVFALDDCIEIAVEIIDSIEVEA
jgi:hypothetical protein